MESNVTLTSKVKGKSFVPLYSYKTKEKFSETFNEALDKKFEVKVWPKFHEIFKL